MNRIHATTLILTLALTAASSAHASNVTFNGQGPHQGVTISHNGNSMSVSAGEIDITYNKVDYKSYCVDLDHTIKSTWTATNAPMSNINGGLAVAYLYDHYALGSLTNVQSAALQIAIWEVVDDFGGTLNLAAGNFQFKGGSADVTNAANAYLAALPGNLNSYVTPSFLVWSGNDPRSQNLVVPEPGTMLGLLVGLPLFVFRKVTKA